jgi:hypothetical protein
VHALQSSILPGGSLAVDEGFLLQFSSRRPGLF